MVRVGDLLELLHDADSRLATFEGEFRDWARPSSSNVLLINSEDPAEPHIAWAGVGPWPKRTERRRRIWFDRPDRIRVEVFRSGVIERIAVRDGNNWCRWDRGAGLDSGPVMARDGVWMQPALLDVPLLSPARLIGWFRLEPAGAGVWRDRDVVFARAWPRNASDAANDLSFELTFDAAYGTLLRHAVLEDGHCVRVTETLRANFNQALDSDRFVLRGPFGPATCE